ncbi:MAG: protein kinase [Terriglobales bacterium]
MNEKTRHLYGFGPFRLDPKECLLILDGKPVPLPPKAFETLLFLVENAGHLVDKDELIRRLWPDTFVEDGNVAKHVSLLRKILSEATNGREYIETIPKHGYRFVAEVRDLADPGAGSQSSTVPDASLIGKKISHYRVLQVLGGGGMGVVYKAEDLKLGRPVALKFLPEELAGDAVALKRFEHEARAASALNHPNICTIYAVEEHEGTSFIAMELLEGRTLRDLIAEQQASAENKSKQGHIQLGTLLDIGIQVVEGLDAAHKKGIIHRDVKPANIFVTSQGQVKILDFGLAKLQESEARDSQPESLVESRQPLNPVLTLTRTGTTVGTAAYMSPEQVLGEKLDARTDLFSFGLVLYEMAAGQRAFPGETILQLHAAILEQSPTPLRELNLGVPAKLETVINRALEKDRQLRYQSASEMRAALESLSSETKRRPSGRLLRLASLALALLAAAGAFLSYRASKHSPNPLPDLKQVQLTANSSENLVEDGAISPDGEYLAYADRKAIQIKEIKSGAVHSIAPPDIPAGTELPPGSIALAWLPDSVRLAVTANTTVLPEPDNFTSPQCTGIWVLSRLASEPARKIRDDGCVWNVSPDGAWIAFTNNGQRSDQFGNQIWLMGPNGEQPHPLFERDEHSRYEAIRWSPNGDRLTYVLTREKGDNLSASVQSRDLQGGAPVTIFPSVPEGDAWWLRGGRLLQSLRDPGTQDFNFWVRPVDQQTGKILGEPTRLTNWTRTEMDNFSATADGKRVAFFRHFGEGTVYIGDLEGARMTNPRHLTLSEDWNIGVAWTADSKAIIFASDRNHMSGLYRQSLDSTTSEPIITGLENWPQSPRVSPDGAWLLYFLERRSTGRPVSSDLMRIPISGGTPQFVLSAQQSARLSCPNAPATLCVISEHSPENERLAFMAFDPARGRGAQTMTLDGPFNADYSWDLSPDGTRVALARSADGPIEILSLKGAAAQKLPPSGWSTVAGLSWTADGKGLLISGLAHNTPTLIQVDLRGRSNVLWSASSGFPRAATASPDGRHVAISQVNTSGNIWMIENF